MTLPPGEDSVPCHGGIGQMGKLQGNLMLSSIRVLDLTDDRGHLAGLLFAQVGAEVLHVEPPGGHRHRQIGPFAGDVADHDRALSHLATDRGKSSVVPNGFADHAVAHRKLFALRIAGGDDFAQLIRRRPDG